jgi:hypothetical protein
VATYRAIAATSEALRTLLDNASRAEDLGIEVKLARAQDFKELTTSRAVTLYLYHVSVSTTRRNLPPRVDLTGRRFRPPTPLDLHYLVTAWSSDALAQHELLGWCVRVLEDTFILPTGLLNQHASPFQVFHPDEAVEVAAEVLSAADMGAIWEMARINQQPSLSYVARLVAIEPEVELTEWPVVRTREFAVGMRVEP